MKLYSLSLAPSRAHIDTQTELLVYLRWVCWKIAILPLKIE